MIVSNQSNGLAPAVEFTTETHDTLIHLAAQCINLAKRRESQMGFAATQTLLDLPRYRPKMPLVKTPPALQMSHAKLKQSDGQPSRSGIPSLSHPAGAMDPKP
ncbi:hypothetical protein RISK_006736 [Rhodopirellula islandica]|uniref:Uncharacterized protein n=1 Tax=Rhodopirellula islandica TaxID=595434 RepID=A0A0J1B313_RHOIS|nr:hypothetical protein RISK_006736 [Rhodopirellula islandica]